MIVLLNGAFGVGKTTVARLLVREVEGSVIYDPERWGYVLQRLPASMLGLRSRPEDFQDLSLWRTLVTRGLLRSSRGGRAVITPMAFTNRSYFDLITKPLEAKDQVLKLCLVAPLEVVSLRLAERGAREGRPVTEFERRRSAECVAAHRDGAFGRPIDADRPAAQVAEEIAGLLQPVRL